MPIEKQEFRRVLGRFAAGVTVVTTVDDARRPYGLTATAFTSVSLEPPLVLVCVDKQSESYPHFHTSGVFAVNFLGAEDEPVSRHFAVSGGDKFKDVRFRHGVTGAPVLAESLAYLECRIVEILAGGDHTIFLGQVEAADARDGEPLLYYCGAYRRLGT